MAHTEEEFREILNAESFVEMDVLASAAKNGVPMVPPRARAPRARTHTTTAPLPAPHPQQ